MFVTIDDQALEQVNGGAAPSRAMMMVLAMLMLKPGGLKMNGEARNKLFDLFKGLMEKKAPAAPESKDNKDKKEEK